MGQKVNPTAFRLGIIKNWQANWYVDRKDFAKTLHADTRVRQYLKQTLAKAGIASISIERPAKSMSVSIQSSRPGIIIGKKGQDIGKFQSQLSAIAGSPVKLKVIEVKKPDIDAQLVAENIASQLERRVLFRRAMKRSIQTAMRGGVQGIKVRVSGRLGGAEIARAEWYREGRIPLHTLRADIDYSTAEAKTSYGVIGVKVWIFKGELLKKELKRLTAAPAPQQPDVRKGRVRP